MSRRRYSPEDQQKWLADQLAELRERGIADAQQIRCLHPEGMEAALKTMLENPNAVRDQSESQRERSRETTKQRQREARAHMEAVLREREQNG